MFIPEVHGGVKEICNSFFKEDVISTWDSVELDQMRDSIAEFITVCENALGVYNKIAVEPSDERLKVELEKHFAILRTEIQPYTKKAPKTKDKKKKGGVKFAA